jgi:tetratricopeptide (TPR) repeat protein
MMAKRVISKSCDKKIGSILIATVLVFAIIGCGTEEAPRIAGIDPLERVILVESELEAIRTWAESGQKADLLIRFDASDDIEIVHPTLAESMKNAADHLKRGNTDVLDQVAPLLQTSGVVALGRNAGLYDRVIWVLPVVTSIGKLPLDGFKSFLVTKRGYSPSDLEDLEQDGRYITGTLGGVPITVTNLEDLSLAGESAIVDIDLSFFTGIPGVAIGYGPGTAAVLEFLRKLGPKRIDSRLVTITLANTTNVAPLEFRYLGPIIKEALSDTTALGRSPAVKLSLAADAERAKFEGRYVAADSIYRALVEEYPMEPGFHYSLALMSGRTGKTEDCIDHLDEAYRLDPVYAMGLFQIANALASERMLPVAKELVERSTLREAYKANELSYSTGVMYVRGGAPAKALPFLQDAARFNPDFRLQNLIYRTSRDAGDEDGMVGSLEMLIEIDPAMVREHMPWVYRELGMLYEKKGDYGSARRMYRDYLVIVPSDSTAAELKEKIRKYGRM